MRKFLHTLLQRWKNDSADSLEFGDRELAIVDSSDLASQAKPKLASRAYRIHAGERGLVGYAEIHTPAVWRELVVFSSETREDPWLVIRRTSSRFGLGRFDVLDARSGELLVRLRRGGMEVRRADGSRWLRTVDPTRLSIKLVRALFEGTPDGFDLLEGALVRGRLERRGAKVLAAADRAERKLAWVVRAEPDAPDEIDDRVLTALALTCAIHRFRYADAS